jgi:hypothetical protein
VTLIALAATGGSARRSIPLLAVLGREATVVSWHRWRAEHERPEVPDAIVVTDVAALEGLPPVALAVWLHDPGDRAAAERHGARILLTDQPDLAVDGVVLVHPSSLDVARVEPTAPLVRARLRDRAGLPEVLVTRSTARASLSEADLCHASAAVVADRDLPLALALGTPIVTSAASAHRIGAEPGRDLVVASEGDEDGAALRLALDPERSARCSAGARRFAERHLDLGPVAGSVLIALGLGSEAPVSPTRTLDDRLDELAAPPGGWVRARMADLVALDVADLGQTPPMADPRPTTPSSPVVARGRALVARAVSPLRSRVKGALAAAAAQGQADLRAEVDLLQRDLEQVRSDHAVELAALHEELAALQDRGSAPPHA